MIGVSNKEQTQREITKNLTDVLIAEGKLVEAGFVGLKVLVMAPNASQTQIDEMRMAFFVGAQHMFASMMAMLDPGGKPTETELVKMNMIYKELQTFVAEFELKHGLATKSS